jgi:hypothetical protein
MSEFIVTIDPNRATRHLKEFDDSKIREFLDVVSRAYRKKPNKKDLDELRKWMNDYPELWRVVFDTAWLLEDNFIKNMVQDKASIIAMKKNTDEIRKGFGYYDATFLEQMLIDNIIISWLGVQYGNFQLVNRMRRDERIVILEFWEKRVNASQRRYLQACESLMRIRRLMAVNPAIQVNIAAQGGQQVNVAGSVNKK